MTYLFQLLRFLSRLSRSTGASRWPIVFAMLTGILAGVASTGFVALINSVLDGRPSGRDLLSFAALCVALPVFRFLSSLLIFRLTENAQVAMRVELSRRILSTSLRRVEEIGPARLLAVLTDDVSSIALALATLPLLLMHTAVVAGCLLYMGWLSWRLLLVMMVVLIAGVLTYSLPDERARHYLQKSRETWNRQFRHFQGLTGGIKELKLHRDKRAAFLDEDLIATARERMGYRQRAMTIQALIASWGQVLFFVVIGLVLFVLPKLGTYEPRVLVGYTLSVLYMLTPLDVILTNFSIFNTGGIAVRQVEELGLALDEADARPAEASPPQPATGWQRLELVGVTHTYRRENADEAFTLGPLDLTLLRGECLFLVGGNGSGKTTLAKLVAGLYLPESGDVRVDGRPVRREELEGYRQMFSAVFSDFHLFDRLIGLDASKTGDTARAYLEKLHLERKVEIRDGTFSTTALSQGQRKRLALLAAYLEDRPIYLFDEWAADQDPIFKEIFYHQLLPELKARGKTTVVISHDDRYYTAADRLVRLESGRFVGEPQPARGGWEVSALTVDQ
jgi:putative ATP-binding cassette transporter